MPKEPSRRRRRSADPPTSSVRSSHPRSDLQDAIARFESEIRELAVALAREAVAREAARRSAASAAGKGAGKGARSGAAPRRGDRQVKEARSSSASAPGKSRRKSASPPAPAQQLPLQLGSPPAPAGGERTPKNSAGSSSEASPQSAAEAPLIDAVKPASSAQRGSKRIVWTADSVIDALVPFVKSRMEVDASFVKRHGPKGLVAAAIRFFGRYPAALNRASLHAAKLAASEPVVAS